MGEGKGEEAGQVLCPPLPFRAAGRLPCSPITGALGGEGGGSPSSSPLWGRPGCLHSPLPYGGPGNLHPLSPFAWLGRLRLPPILDGEWGGRTMGVPNFGRGVGDSPSSSLLRRPEASPSSSRLCGCKEVSSSSRLGRGLRALHAPFPCRGPGDQGTSVFVSPVARPTLSLSSCLVGRAGAL